MIEELKWGDIVKARQLISKYFSSEEGGVSIFHFLLSKMFLKKIGFHELKYFVSKEQGEICGITGIYSFNYHPKHTIWLGWTVVKPQNRGRGIGRALIEFVINYLRTNKYSLLAVETTSHSNQEGAISLYKSLGFQECGRITKYYKDHDFIIMANEISSSN